jgi:dTDP-4-dehydrorhamnose 3,5-epimerase
MSVLPEIDDTEIPGVLLVRPAIFQDERGYFLETYNAASFLATVGASAPFVQDNESVSIRNTIRGIHYQLPPHAQAKLVRCVTGSVWDVAVDLRRRSPSFGRWTGAVLTDDGAEQLWIPAGFGHGFVALSDRARVAYKATSHYEPSASRSLAWDDPEVGVEWPVDSDDVVIDKRDRTAPNFADADVFS